MKQKKISLKTQLIIILAPAVVFLCLFLLFSTHLLGEASRDNHISYKTFTQLHFRIQHTQTALQKLRNALYRVTLDSVDASLGDTVLADIESTKKSVATLTGQLNNYPSSMTNEELINTYIANLNNRTYHLESMVTRYHEIVSNPYDRYPGLLLLNEKLLKHNTEFLHNIEIAIDEAVFIKSNRTRRHVENMLRELRYAWTQKISWFRLFIANRSGIFGSAEESMAANLLNRQIYQDKIDQILKDLNKNTSDQNASFAGLVSLQNIYYANEEYEKYFTVARDLYLSKNWRADYSFLKNNVEPAINDISQTLKSLVKEIQTDTTSGISTTIDATENITLAIIILITALLVSFAYLYLLFSSRIIRPVYQMSNALKSIATGESQVHLPNVRHRETQNLVDAFHYMSEQVQSRQTRLETILDNAVEGIITMDEKGNIETYNIAAQQLFAYDADEVKGLNFESLLSRDAVESQHVHLQTLLQSDSGDYLGKEFELVGLRKDGTSFPVSIKLNEFTLAGNRFFTALVEDVSEKKAFIDNLRNLAEHDSLTGLYNRYYFTQELKHTVERVKRNSSTSYALVYLDLDNFKYINDTMGHLAGDQLLVEISILIRTQLRKSDLLARFGGDEFAILLYDVDVQNSLAVAEKIRQTIKDYLFKSGGTTVDVGCSIGVTMIDEQVSDSQQLFSQADFACHAAKCSGRNQVRLYTEEDHKRLEDNSSDISWSHKITCGLRDDRFIVAYQPVRDLKNEQQIKYEVLVRLITEDGTVIMPPGFIPAAERFGLIEDIDRWVINQVFQQIKHYYRDEDSHFAINLSAQSLSKQGMLEYIKEEIKTNDIDAQRIIFEITETSAMQDISVSIHFLEELRKMGCRTALDDFGVGYSSFAYLRELPVDIIKIDGGFVHDVHSNRLNYAIIKSINDIALALGKSTVAEFVNCEEALAIMREIGVNCVQGFYIGRPFFPEHEKQRLGIKQSDAA